MTGDERLQALAEKIAREGDPPVLRYRIAKVDYEAMQREANERIGRLAADALARPSVTGKICNYDVKFIADPTLRKDECYLLKAALPKSTDPLDVKHGGVTLRHLLRIDEARRREGHPNYRTAWLRLSDDQRAAVSAHWSAELRAKVAAAKERDRQQITVDGDD